MTKQQLKQIIKEEFQNEFNELPEEQKKNNPWAICTASVGREDKEKYERCVQDVKAEADYKED